jgi:aldose sugar dehydrogenase
MPHASFLSRRSTLSRRSFLVGSAALPVFGATTRARAQQTFKSAAGTLKLDTMVEGLENPWGISFASRSGPLLITERPGRLRTADLRRLPGRLSRPISGLPDVAARGQGGLLDVAVEPYPNAVAGNGLVYWTYSEPRDGGNGTAVARGLYDGSGMMRDVEVIFRQMPTVSSRNHFGSRLAFAPDGTLFVTLGDRYSERDKAQTLDNHLGKVVRINKDGSIPASNPFVGQEGVEPAIWSYGHRNAQGAAINPATGALWTVEHGARGGDEVNIPAAGKNYGWPIITYGRDYSGLAIGEGTAKQGMEQPIHYWDPSIAPSGMAFYTGDLIPAWKGSLFIGALAGMMLVRLSLDGDKVTGEERLLEDLGQRIRDVRQGPDGALYIVTDSDEGQVLRLSLA